MARIERVSPEEAGEDIAGVFQYARDGFAAMTGRHTEGAVEPLQIYAHVPSLLRGVLALAQATAGLKGLPRRYEVLATLRAATLTQCGWCIDISSQVSRLSGLRDEELLALPNYGSSNLFSNLDKLVLDYATGVSRTPVDVSDELFEALQEHFDEGQLVELTHAIALENMYGRFNHAMGIGASGFTEGMVCAVPASA
ncbi:MAG: carboxymuconolactone decarboxylase family protein [Dehalococcoidia bacterium]